MADQHEKCACGFGAFRDDPPDGDGRIYCWKCAWRAPSWEDWDEVMRANREARELAAARAAMKHAAEAAMKAYCEVRAEKTDDE
jgi:hypothetical protein